MLLLITLALSYALGSLSFAILLPRLTGGPDPRTYGSGNPGATNVLRAGNRKIAIAVLVLDALKGAIPVWAVMVLDPSQSLGAAAPAAAGLAAFLGHLYPVFFRFQGGKGVATAIGAVLGLHAGLALMLLVIFAGVLYRWRHVSLAAMCAAAAAPVLYALFIATAGDALGNTTALLLVMAALLVWRHRANIERLRAGTESRWLTPAEKRAQAAESDQNSETAPHPDTPADAAASPPKNSAD
ncbi:glycerol-3-phosphate 1-O-acyltransferase PlsY [Amphibiibacter pelophylacis]|uniref:Glycerol-3-phosphate 1-O-acyltransferase PlsY n=1 Tax=Amphibiibacter pelophylacis TaxID=1799477 RepID=A0ACC6P075_9BURK